MVFLGTWAFSGGTLYCSHKNCIATCAIFHSIHIAMHVPADVFLWQSSLTLQRLMLEPTSPILDFYPLDFVIDSEGKRAEWEGVVLIPFIDEARLLLAASLVPASALTPEEHARNQHGDVLVFKADQGGLAYATIPPSNKLLIQSSLELSIKLVE